MNVALIAFDPKTRVLSESFKRCQRILEFCRAQEIDFCIFPETTFSGFSFPSIQLAEFYENSPTIEFFRAEAAKLELTVMFGLFLKSLSSECVYNSAIVVDKNGEIASRYNKIHLFSQAREHQFNTQGDSIEKIAIQNVHFGVSICYDLRFPEMFMNMSKNCPALVNISNWPSKREFHWRCLLKARAIENQSFVLGVNRSGFDIDGLHFNGISRVYDPSGGLVKPRVFLEEEKVSVYSVDFSQVEKVRENFRALDDRRFVSSLLNSSE
jgi:omega-amidase